MLKGKAQHFFSESITKLNNIIFKLDKQIGTSNTTKTLCTNNKINLPNEDSSKININVSKNITKEETTQINPEKLKNNDSKKANENKPTKSEKTEKTKDSNTEKKVAETSKNIFDECDLRVGRVKEIKAMENSEIVYCLKVDLGEGTLRDIGTGLQKYLPTSEFQDKNVVVFSNLRPKKLGNFFSNGMVMCASDEAGTSFELVRPNESIWYFLKFIIDAKPGESVFLEGGKSRTEPLGTLNDKKFKKAIDLFSSNENCIAMWDSKTLVTESGPLLVKSLKLTKIS